MEPFDIKRPWGSFRQFTTGIPVTVKILTVNAGQRISLQYHKQRREFWHIISGTPTVTIGEKVIEAKPGDEFMIETGEQHRLAGGPTGTSWLEIAYGNFDEEGDNVKIEDDYGRK